MKKKGALEFSMTTVIIIVLAVVLLILGIYFVRGIMCSGINLTGEINSKVKGEIDRLFEYSEGEVVCLGEGTDIVKIAPDEVNFVYCSIDASQADTQYEFEVVEYTGESLKESEIENWVVGDDKISVSIAPGDKTPQKIVRLRVPKDAPEEVLTLELKWKKKVGTGSWGSASTKILDFQVSRKGFIRATIC